MTDRHIPMRRRVHGLAAAAILAATAVAGPALACKNPAFITPDAALFRDQEPRVELPDDAVAPVLAEYALVDSTPGASIVGMWHTILRLGGANGPVFDEVLEQFHSDGTELLISNGLPPALGNICIGIWKRVGGRSYKLRHMTWNWAPDEGGFGVPGAFAGHFELEVNFTLDASGRTFAGNWSARNFDPAGEHLPELDADGVINGVRLTVD